MTRLVEWWTRPVPERFRDDPLRGTVAVLIVLGLVAASGLSR